MKRYFFFALLFPPAFMNLLLTVARPADLLHYFLAGYFGAILPALTIAFIDGILESGSAPVRAGWSGLVGFVLTPVPFLAFESATAWQAAQIAVCGGIVGFLCTMALIQFADAWTLLREMIAQRRAQLMGWRGRPTRHMNDLAGHGAG